MLFQLWGELQKRKTRDLGLLFPGQTNKSSYHPQFRPHLDDGEIIYDHQNIESVQYNSA